MQEEFKEIAKTIEKQDATSKYCGSFPTEFR